MSWLTAFWLGCSSPAGDRSPPEHPRHSAPPDAAPAPVVTGPSERDCLDQFAHAIDLELAAARAPAESNTERLPTETELATLRAELRDTYLPACRAGTMEGHHCAMAATTLDQLANCHSTPSNSTSNSSVAPGGITPAAPRSP